MGTYRMYTGDDGETHWETGRSAYDNYELRNVNWLSIFLSQRLNGSIGLSDIS